MSYFLVIRGPLGAGKTSVARALADRLGARPISIDPILERWRWDGGSERLFLRANRAAVARALPWLVRGVPVVLEGNFYWVRVLDDLAERLPYPHRTFTLKVPLDVCIERDRHRARSYGAKAARAVFRKASRVRRGIPVDGSGTIPAVVREIVGRTISLRRSGPEGGATPRRRPAVRRTTRPAPSIRTGRGSRPAGRWRYPLRRTS